MPLYKAAGSNLTSLVAADGSSGGFVKDSDRSDAATARAMASSTTVLTPANLGDIGVLSGLLFGLTLANNGTDPANDIDIAAGACIDSTNGELMTLSALTKRLDAGWAAGTNQGMRNSAEAIADTTYHIFAVCKAGGADPDIYALGNSQGATAAVALAALQAETGGSTYAFARRIGSILRVSSNIVAFTQNGDEFLLSTPVSSISAANPGTSAVLADLRIPLGVKVDAIVSAGMTDASPAAATNLLVTSPDTTDVAAGSGLRTVLVFAAGASVPQASITMARIRTNTAGQIRYRLQNSDADISVAINTVGWVDTRGRLAA